MVPMANTLFRRASAFVALSLAATLGCGGDLSLPSSPGEVAGEPDTARALSPVSQPGRIGQPTSDDPTVLVLDRLGNPVGDTEVAWDVTTGKGTVNSARTVTDADGKASVTWTLGPSIGVQKLNARVEGAHGSPVAFTATVLF